MNILKTLFENRLAIIVIILMCIMGIVARHIVHADAAFSHAFLVYASVADDADTAAYIPTATNNPTRQQVNIALVQILSNIMTNAERLEKAERGLSLMENSQSEIDNMTPKVDAVAAAITAMEKSVTPGDFLFQRGDPQKIIVLAKERLAAVKDIQALSYRANFQTEKIFKHIVDTKGELSSAYVNDLNNELPADEDDYNRRQNRYSDMQIMFDKIQQTYIDFTSITSPRS